MSELEHEALAAAALDALRAPSVFNTQPWRWRLDGRSLVLLADRSRGLSAVDPEGRMLLLSCGAALHHARVCLAASGWSVEVARLVESLDDDLLARLVPLGPADVEPDAPALRAAIMRRRTDRRPFGDEAPSASSLDRLVGAAAAEGVDLHVTRPDEVPMLAIAVARAGAAEMSDAEYLTELMRWTNRPRWSADGVPLATVTRPVARRVPVRDFAAPPGEAIAVEPGGDRGSAYLILHGPGDAAPDWLRAGEALSAVLLTAVVEGLSVEPMTDVVEVERARDLLRALVDGDPYAVVRCGIGPATVDLPEAPRRAPADVIDGLDPEILRRWR